MAKAVRNLKSTSHPPIVLRLRVGWHYDDATQQFRGDKQRAFTPTGLPKQTRIEPQIPALAKKKRRTQAEDELARGFHVIHPADTASEDVLQAIRKWPCVEKAWIAPTPVPAKGTATISRGKQTGASKPVGGAKRVRRTG